MSVVVCPCGESERECVRESEHARRLQPREHVRGATDTRAIIRLLLVIIVSISVPCYIDSDIISFICCSFILQTVFFTGVLFNEEKKSKVCQGI